jgi:hypothetical protein
MTSLVLEDLILESLTPSANALLEQLDFPFLWLFLHHCQKKKSNVT